MKSRLALLVLCLFLLAVPAQAELPRHAHVLPRQADASYWHKLAVKRLGLLGKRERQLSVANTNLHRRWTPTVDYALRLASAVYGVPLWQMRRVAYCESTDNPFAVNGKYKGILQLGWSPFGFSPFDPVASALSAAQTVRHDGSWKQWECKKVL